MRRLLLALALLASPAFADDSYPPAPFDIGGATEADVLVNYSDLFGNSNAPPLIRTEFGQAKAECDRISMERFGAPYPASATANGETLTGCLIRDWSGSNPVIVYSFRPGDPEFGVRLLRHEIGHLLGWPADHKR